MAIKEPRKTYRRLLSFFKGSEEATKIFLATIFVEAFPESAAEETTMEFIHALKKDDTENVLRILTKVAKALEI